VKRLAAILLLLLAAQGAHAQAQHPNWEKGIAAEKAYEFGDLDTVNLFNGNLNISIPIGQTYHLGGNLSYGLVLHYGGNSWEFADVERTVEGDVQKHYIWPYPGKRHNAGFGWRLSFGELTHDMPCAGLNGWTYVAPDGGTHCFGALQHPTDLSQNTTPGVYYSADGSYIRFDSRDPNNLKVEFPDGTYHVFDNSGRIKSMNDRFGNFVTITYTFDEPGHLPHWTITDSAGRAHEVLFKRTATYAEELGVDVDHVAVSQVNLKAAGGVTAPYVFHYVGENGPAWPQIARHPINLSGEIDPNMPENTFATLLSSIDMPEGLNWNFQHYTCLTVAGDCPDASGSLQSVTLPTGGELSWTYQQFAFAGASFQINPNKPLEGTLYQTPVAVETRTMKYNNAILGTREYAQEVTNDGEHRVLVTDHFGDLASPIIRRTRNYFSTCSQNCPYGKPAEYGLPLSRNPAVNDFADVAVSSEDLGPVAGAWTQVLRRRYVQYEADVWMDNIQSPVYTDYNRRVVKERTKYEDGKTAGTTYDKFDGLGHYRKTTTDGTFGSRDVRVSYTDYNPAVSSYKANAGGYDPYPQFPIAAGVPWILNKFKYDYATETLPDAAGLSAETVTAMTEACFDANGFLTSRRTFHSKITNTANPPYLTTDLLAVFTADTRGNIATEKYYGGDDPAHRASTSSCGAPTDAEAFSLAHTWAANGALLTSAYNDASNNTVLQILHQDADPSTGFITTSYDTAGVATSFGYDKLGRIRTMTPAGAAPASRSASASYDYSMNPPKVVTTQSTAEAVAPLPLNTLIFDGFGRLTEQQKRMPNETTSIVRTEYNGLGWKTRVSEAEEAPTHYTEFDYDALGRPKVVTAADKSTVAFAYTGASQTARTVSVATDPGPTNATTIETYDRLGKLWKVTEPNNIVTKYSYDIGGRLRSVCMNAIDNGGCGQTRTFEYDNRGFLQNEKHPERPLTSYSNYDARGHALQRSDGVTTLTFEYDRAERLFMIRDDLQRPVKQFVFADTNSIDGDYRKGKLATAIRNNWVYDASTQTKFNFQVVEAYEYKGRDGRVSKRTTLEKSCVVVTNGEQCTGILPGGSALVKFYTTIDHDPLGSPSALGYPKCDFTECQSAIPSAPTITNRYRRGMLEAVEMPGAPKPNTISYLSNGLVDTVAHANDVSDWQIGDPSGMRRPYMLGVSGASDASSCTAATIAAQPASTTVESNTGTSLTATINGDVDTTSHPFTLQWYRGAAGNIGDPVGGATNVTLGPGSVKSTLPVTVSSTTSYWLRASNGCGSADTTTATVSTCSTVSISGQPSGVTVGSGQTAVLTVTAAGSAPRYQWYQGPSGNTSTPVGGATSNTLSFVPTATASYWVRVSNDCAAVANSVAVEVTVTPPPAPAGVVATYQGAPAGILVTWNPVSTPAGIRFYILQRRFDRTGYHDYQTLGGSTLSYLDADAVTDHAYVYRVRVVDNNGVSSVNSLPDVATATTFVDSTITSGVTLIQGVHFSQMRKAIDAMRTVLNQTPLWGPTYPPLTGTVLAADVNAMRGALANARSLLGLPAITYPTQNLTAGTIILRSDLVAMRSGVQ
jgi:YD repeat-containing protein